MTINSPKSQELEFLGHTIKISTPWTKPSPKHTVAIRDYRTPRTKEDISRFLDSFCGFMFIPSGAQLLQLLTYLIVAQVCKTDTNGPYPWLMKGLIRSKREERAPTSWKGRTFPVNKWRSTGPNSSYIKKLVTFSGYRDFSFSWWG